MHRARRAWAVLALGVCWLAFAEVASAQWTAAVLDFEGRAAGQARGAVVTVAREKAELVPSEQVEAAARRLHASLDTPEGIAEVAAEQNLTMIVTGRVTGRGPRARVSIQILDAEGAELASAEARSPRGRSARRNFNRQMGRAFDQAIAELDRRAAAARQDEASDEQEEVAQLDDEEYDGEGDEEDDEDDEDDADDGGDGERVHPYILGLVAFGGRGRNATVNLANGMRRIYEVTMYPELSFYVEGRPLAGASPGLAGIYLAFQMGFAVGLKSQEQLPGGMVRDIGSSAWRMEVLAGYLAPLGPVELGANIGFSHEAFSLDMNDTMPTTEYPGLRVGLAFRVPLYEQLIRLQVDGGLRFPFGTGALAPTFGTSAGAFGFDVVGAITGALDVGFTYALRFGYTGYSLSFDGSGAIVDDTADGGFDGGLLFNVGLGWQI